MRGRMRIRFSHAKAGPFFARCSVEGACGVEEATEEEKISRGTGQREWGLKKL